MALLLLPVVDNMHQEGEMMTDDRTAELREKLTERGVEWTKPKSAAEFIQTTFLRNGWGIEVLERNIGLCVTATNVFDTPEQVIAATLGEDEKLLDLAHHAWDIAVCAMQGMPIPASWGNAVEKGLRERGIDVDKLPYVVPDATLGDGEYEAKMDALLSRLTNGKWSKSKDYDLDFIESCVNEEFENLYAKELADATLGSGNTDTDDVLTLLDEIREAGRISYDDYSQLFDAISELGSGTCELHDCEGSFSALNRPVWRCDCGAFMTQYTDATTYHKPRFCPNCGRKAVE